MKPTINISITPARLALALGLIAGIAWAANEAIDYGSRIVKGNLTVNGTVTSLGPEVHPGVLSVGVVDAGLVKTDLLDAGSGRINGNLEITGTAVTGSVTFSGAASGPVLTAVSIDAGVVRSAGVPVPSAIRSDGGVLAIAAIQFGTSLLSGNSATIVFAPAYSAIPQCVCSSTNATAAACDASATSTTQTVLKGTNASDNVNWICIGDK